VPAFEIIPIKLVASFNFSDKKKYKPIIYKNNSQDIRK
jgi:hypothetical protein